MRCKVGDLAVIIHDGNNPVNVGRIVVISSPSSLWPGAWVVEAKGAPLLNPEGRPYVKPSCDDCCMRPIRDNDGPDESLTWAPRSEHLTDILEHAKEQQ